MSTQTVLTTSEAAEQLNVHARTIRKWIDAFPDFVQPDINERGHYMLHPKSIAALQTIQKHLKAGNKSLKQVREELVRAGKLPDQSSEHVSQIADELTSINDRLIQLEKSHQSTIQLLEQLSQTIHGVQKKQEQLKLEIRHATFDMRLNAAEHKTKRKKTGVLRLSQLFR